MTPTVESSRDPEVAEDALRDKLDAAAFGHLEAAGRSLRQEVERDWPLLSFHYGLSISELLHTPRWLRRAYIARLDELLARERLARLEEVSFPYMDASARRTVTSKLKRAAKFPEPPASKPRSLDEMTKGLAGIGIAVEMVGPDA